MIETVTEEFEDPLCTYLLDELSNPSGGPLGFRDVLPRKRTAQFNFIIGGKVVHTVTQEIEDPFYTCLLAELWRSGRL